MPEGDTIHYAANRIRPVLEGRVPDELETPHPRFGRDRWPERLAGRAVRSVDAHGKHLFLRFEGGLTIHSHLRMTGSWRVLRPRSRSGSDRRGRAWLRARRGEREVVQFNGPVLELMTDSRTRLRPPDRRPRARTSSRRSSTRTRVLRRLREDDPTRPIGDALLDQRTIAGIGNLWKVEGCFAAGIDPWRPAGEVSDEEVLRDPRRDAPADAARPRRDGIQDRFKAIYGTAGRPCPRCARRDRSLVQVRGQWDDNRPTFWCPGVSA